MSPITIIVIKDDKVVKKVITNQNDTTKRIIELIKIPVNPYEILMLQNILFSQKKLAKAKK